MNPIKNKTLHDNRNSFWEIAQLAENKYWRTRCSDAIGIFYEMGEDLDLPWMLQKTLKRNPQSFLDVGVGPMGVGLHWMYPKTPIRIGIDPLTKINVLTGNSYADKLVEEICRDSWYSRGRGEELPFRSNFFELVVCHNVLDHVSEPISMLNEVCRVTQKGGYVGISVDTNSRLGNFLRKIDRKLRSHLNTYKQHPHDFIIGEIGEFLKSKGFDILFVNNASFLGGLLGRRRRQSWVAIKTL